MPVNVGTGDRRRPLRSACRTLVLPLLAAVITAGCGDNADTATGPSLAAGGTRLITVSPGTNPVSFGTVTAPFGSANVTTQTFTVTNTGTRSSSGITVALTGTGAAAYGILPGDDGCTGRSLTTSGKNKTCMIKVTFAPTETGTFTAALVVNVAQPKSTTTINLTGAAGPATGTIAFGPHVNGPSVSTLFFFTGPGIYTTSTIMPDADVSSTYNAGSYTISPNVPAGYALTGITCLENGPAGYTNTASTTSLYTASATANLDSGETVACTFTISALPVDD
jgi:hypothetical protein